MGQFPRRAENRALKLCVTYYGIAQPILVSNGPADSSCRLAIGEGGREAGTEGLIMGSL
jgi:hypothetical protein